MIGRSENGTSARSSWNTGSVEFVAYCSRRPLIDRFDNNIFGERIPWIAYLLEAFFVPCTVDLLAEVRHGCDNFKIWVVALEGTTHSNECAARTYRCDEFLYFFYNTASMFENLRDDLRGITFRIQRIVILVQKHAANFCGILPCKLDASWRL